MAETVATLDQKIADITNEIGKLTARNQLLSQQIPQHQALSRAATSAGNYPEGKRISDIVDALDAERSANNVRLQSLNVSLKTLQDQRSVAVEADAARNRALDAQTKLTEKLTPEQVLQIQLEKNKAQAASDDKASKDKNTRMYIIFGIVFIVIVIAGILIWKKVSTKAA
jgi:hypothetical protein